MAASRASPMSDALELCARYSSAADMEGLLPELTGIIRRGVGLNTKVGVGPRGGLRGQAVMRDAATCSRGGLLCAAWWPMLTDIWCRYNGCSAH